MGERRSDRLFTTVGFNFAYPTYEKLKGRSSSKMQRPFVTRQRRFVQDFREGWVRVADAGEVF
ncbi:hypothetical protein AGMMS49545_08110 [Betaproteobacteria bacterium]|nr:hypothetical protein AGMMS49545_08110 [Betaproteobacteria bacterium]GHU40495.1 hypothetical protein AGMMS50289_02130 [Betaproteobacteria bacterium]